MEARIQETLRRCVSLALSMLPRYVRHDFWRQCEPQHQRAQDHIIEEVVARLDSEFEIALRVRPPDPTYLGTGQFMGPAKNTPPR